MDYGRLLKRAWTNLSAHKFLILLGALAALGSGSGGGNVSWQVHDSNGGGRPPLDFDTSVFANIPVALLVGLIGVALVIGLALWVITRVARGGLIAAVDEIESGEQVTLMSAWAAGWQKVWPLLGIALLPAIPILLLLIGGLIAVGTLTGLSALVRGDFDFFLNTNFAVTIAALLCLAVPLAVLFTLLRNFAERACILENLGVVSAYRRGGEVLLHNLGPAIILFLIQGALAILLGIGLIGPGIVMVLCFLLWPVLWLIGGAVTAYFSTLWTLAWREWTVGQTSGLIQTELPNY
jgi:hypothetical protein